MNGDRCLFSFTEIKFINSATLLKRKHTVSQTLYEKNIYMDLLLLWHLNWFPECRVSYADTVAPVSQTHTFTHMYTLVSKRRPDPTLTSPHLVQVLSSSYALPGVAPSRPISPADTNSGPKRHTEYCMRKCFVDRKEKLPVINVSSARNSAHKFCPVYY